MRERSSERRWDCTRPGGASSTRSVERNRFCKEPPAWRLFCLRSVFCASGARMIKVGIVGGTGYTGIELLRILSQHPGVELRAITSRKEAGTPVSAMFPSLRRRVELAFTEPGP